jgi:hypothetical protein
MSRMIDHLGHSADMVIIDAPPLWTAELAQIVPFAQGLLVIARKSSPQLADLMKMLSRTAPASTGLVLTV